MKRPRCNFCRNDSRWVVRPVERSRFEKTPTLTVDESRCWQACGNHISIGVGQACLGGRDAHVAPWRVV